MNESAVTAVLSHLYSSTLGEQWSSSTNWMSAASVCSWSGVTCASSSSLKVSLQGRNLRGNLPTELGSLGGSGHEVAVDLFLYSNPLSGTLPTQLGNLELSSFDVDLHYTSLSGAMPTELGQLTAPGSPASCRLSSG
jgi:hypothetical protein